LVSGRGGREVAERRQTQTKVAGRKNMVRTAMVIMAELSR